MHRQLSCIAETVGVIVVGMIALVCGLKLFGHGLVGTVASVWSANVMMLLAIQVGLRARGQRWHHLGLRADIFDPRQLARAFLYSVPVFVLAIVAFAMGAILMANILGIPEPADMSKYDYLRGNLALTMVALASVYLVSSFAEEVIYRGFMMTRLVEAGDGKGAAYGAAIAVSSLVFGLVHSDWGLAGMVQASFMGMALGIAFLAVRRNLWVTIFAHAYMDTILILQMYFAR